ncbi:MAG: membrane protein insertase YidC [Prevotellaceae bacterium]|jgi:YidC/Oxa1 family membrane protein insertase|nr:membrane protein insertase YidC [Prevotellaceae bacterium]
MDKNTVIGLILIVGIFLGFSWLNKPSEEQKLAQQHYRDSIAQAQSQAQREAAAAQQLLNEQKSQEVDNDSVIAAKSGLLANVAKGDSSLVVVETDLLKLQFSPKGGSLYSAELKEYLTHDSLPLVLFDGKEENLLAFTFSLKGEVFSSENLFFKPQEIVEDSVSKRLTFRLEMPDTAAFIDFVYTLYNDRYVIDFDIVTENMFSFFDNRNYWEMVWKNKIRQQEKGRKFENNYTTLNYQFANGDMETLSAAKNDMKEPSTVTPLQWIATKDQFFSTVLLAKQGFSGAKLRSNIEPENSKYLKSFSVESDIFFDYSGRQATNLQIFLVPNHYKTLTSFNKGLEKGQKPNLQRIIPLGWSIFGWINQILIIPMFNFFGSFMTNFGLIILLMTVVIKLIILPMTFKSYMSTAKMRVLRPQVDAINAKIPADKPMERQQATMALYKSVGVSPMGGCLPMLLQMPILFAMFAFFPSAIELRQQSFLWAADLSTYDTVPFLTWSTSIFGFKHLSLFCLLMTITNIIYTKLNMQDQAQQQQMAMMKWMMYLMPLMFLFFFNNYPSGLSYYYLVSLLITIGQTYLFRLFVDEKELLRKLELAKHTKKPAKKSGFMARLEAAQKEQQKRIREQQKKGKR